MDIVRYLLAVFFTVGFVNSKTVPQTPNQFPCSVKSETGKSFEPGSKWPGGVVPYVFDSSLTADDISEAQKAFEVYHEKTCIRFVPKTSTNIDYISIEYDPNTCGDAEVCRKGGKQFVRIGGACRTSRVLVHELGHALCLQHEETRPDRDSYLEFNGCPPPALKPDSDTLGMLYDYKSAMHGSCNSCMMPKMGGVSPSTCGGDFSVLDAEKVNAFYDCKGDIGCLAYRFRPANDLSDQERENMHRLGSSWDGQPMYACRAYHNGDIIPGTFQNEICHVGYNGFEYSYKGSASGVEVFTFSNPGGSVNSNKYRWHEINAIAARNEEEPIPPSAVPGGREASGDTTYIGLCIVQVGERFGYVVGKVRESDPWAAYVPFQGLEHQCTLYFILVCE